MVQYSRRMVSTQSTRIHRQEEHSSLLRVLVQMYLSWEVAAVEVEAQNDKGTLGKVEGVAVRVSWEKEL